jgi:hypothetical protein
MLVPLANIAPQLAAKSPTQQHCRSQMAKEIPGMPPSKSRVSLDSVALLQILTASGQVALLKLVPCLSESLLADRRVLQQ